MGFISKFLAVLEDSDSDDLREEACKFLSMNPVKKRKMLEISRRFTAEIEAALQDSPELRERYNRIIAPANLWCPTTLICFTTQGQMGTDN